MCRWEGEELEGRWEGEGLEGRWSEGLEGRWGSEAGRWEGEGWAGGRGRGRTGLQGPLARSPCHSRLRSRLRLKQVSLSSQGAVSQGPH